LVLSAQGNLSEALTSYQKSLAVMERLATVDPGNAGWQRDLCASYWRMATMNEKTNPGNAMMWWQKMYDQLSGMKQRGLFLSS
jgi:hypothetical protein